MPIKAILFDLDGTLIDSEDNYFEADRLMLQDYGIPFTLQDKKEFVGSGNRAILQVMKKRYGISDPVEKLLEKKNSLYLGIALKNTPVYPAMLDFVMRLKNNRYPLAVASGTSPEILTKILEHTALSTFFQAVVSAESVKNSKPEPDVFLEAAKRLGVEPGNCVVVEDSQYGVEAALRAGMKCISVPYFTEKPLQPVFYKSSLLFEDGMKCFDAEVAYEWVTLN